MNPVIPPRADLARLIQVMEISPLAGAVVALLIVLRGAVRKKTRREKQAKQVTCDA